MKISVVVPVFNVELYLRQCLDSIINQSYSNLEIILVDDGSEDQSLKICEDFASKDSRIKVIHQKNAGVSVARNKGIEAATGEYITFLDSDDTWNSHKLEKQVEFMLTNDYAFTYTAYHKVNEKSEYLSLVKIPVKTSYNDLLKTCVIGCLTAMYDAEKLGKITFPLIRKRQDFALWLKILKKVPFAYGLDEDLASYNIRNDSISANKLKAAQYNWHLYRKIEKLSLIQSLYYFSHYTIKGIIRTKFPHLAHKFKI